MVSVQKVNFKANGSAWLPPNYVTNVASNASSSTPVKAPISQPLNPPSVTQPSDSTATVQSQTQAQASSVATKPVGSDVNKNNSSSEVKTAKTVAYVSAGIALASMGVGIVLRKQLKANSELVKTLSASLDDKLAAATKKMTEEAVAGAKVLEDKITGLGKWQDGQIGTMKAELKAEISNASSAFVKTPSGGYLGQVVEINGQHLNLATIHNDISKPEVRKAFENELRSESTKRLFGFAKPLAKIPENPYIRIVSVELKPFTAVGGMSIVPKELAEELPKVINKHNSPVFVLDTPLYRGRVGMDNGQEVTWKLIEDKASGAFSYQKFVDNKFKESYKLDKIDDMNLKLIGQESEKVRLFRANLDGSAVPFEQVEKLFDPEYMKTIDAELAKLAEEAKPRVLDFKFGQNGLNFKQVGKEKSLPFMKEGLTQEQVKNTFDSKKLEALGIDVEKISKTEAKQVIESKDYNIIIENKSLKIRPKEGEGVIGFKEVDSLLSGDYLKSVESARTNAELEAGKLTFETDSYKITQYADNTRKFVPKLKCNLWDNRKFNMDIPLGYDAEIYTDKSISSGLTERAIYFNKYIYEHTVNMKSTYADEAIKDKSGKVLLKADAFINQDWETGPLTAMIRLSTIAKKYYGKLNSDVAEKIQNMPILTVVNNARPQGNVWYEKERFLNTMFDELTAKVVPNAWASNLSEIKDASIPGDLLNPLFRNQDINPLHMVAAYSDDLAFVSEGYNKEAFTNNFFGCDLTHLYSLRNKTAAKENPAEYVTQMREMAKKNNVNMDGITDEQILRPTAFGRNNGLNKANNILTKKEIDDALKDPKFGAEFKQYGFDKLKPYKDNMTAQEAYEWKMNNKGLALKYLEDAVAGAKGFDKNGNMNAWLGDKTNLAGVTVKTPVFETAGRINDQKGYELYLSSIEHYAEKIHKAGDEVPVFVIQGQVLDGYGKSMVELTGAIKEKLTKNGHKDFADRIVFLDRGDGFKYTISKLFTDSPVMASIFEPCGLTHKEFMNKGGGISVGNETGGIMAGLEDGLNIFGVKYEANPPNGIKAEHYEENIKNYAEGMKRAVDAISNPEKYGKMLKESLSADFSWTNAGGTAFKYVDDLANYGLVPRVAEKAAV